MGDWRKRCLHARAMDPPRKPDSDRLTIVPMIRTHADLFAYATLVFEATRETIERSRALRAEAERIRHEHRSLPRSPTDEPE
jgi:hypothetical protein